MRQHNNIAQKEYKTKHHGEEKVIHWELCKKFKFDHTKKMVYAQTGTRPRK